MARPARTGRYAVVLLMSRTPRRKVAYWNAHRTSTVTQLRIPKRRDPPATPCLLCGPPVPVSRQGRSTSSAVKPNTVPAAIARATAGPHRPLAERQVLPQPKPVGVARAKRYSQRRTVRQYAS
jgi:hypothetical protein